MSNIMSNRNSTPEAGHANMRPLGNRPVGLGMAQARPSSDATLLAQVANRPIRPSSDFYGQSGNEQGQGSNDTDTRAKEEQEWLTEIDQYENTLEEMAEATQDQEFKDELAAIEQWFLVLSEAERTAALYALLQQTTRVQIRFFIQLLRQKDRSHPVPGILSPANFEKDAMSSRLDGAMNRLSVQDSARNSTARPNSTARHSTLDPAMISQLFPDAAGAIASAKADFTAHTGKAPPVSNRNSMVDNRNSLATPTIQAPSDEQGNPQSPWAAGDASRPKSSSGQTPMGQFSIQAPPVSAGLRSPRPPQINSNNNIQSTTLENKQRHPMADMPLLSPYAGSGNWSSMVNTPMVANFSQGPDQAKMVANAAAMKLNALATVQNRVVLDDGRKFRRARSNDPSGNQQQMPQTPFLMIGPQGQLNQVFPQDQQIAARNQQTLGFGGRSRPSSPGIAMQGSFAPNMAFASPQGNQYLNLPGYDGSSPIMNNGLAPMTLGMGMASFGSYGGGEGYLSDHSDMMRGRSPRGRRGTPKPLEDPTDPTLLQDIPSWLRSLRLHKYTDNLKDMKWVDLVELDEDQLIARGVAATGARRKMLKVFEEVKSKFYPDEPIIVAL